MGRGELLTICHFWYYSHHAWVSPRLATLCCWEIWVDGLLIDCQLSNLTRSRAWAMRVYYSRGEQPAFALSSWLIVCACKICQLWFHYCFTSTLGCQICVGCDSKQLPSPRWAVLLQFKIQHGVCRVSTSNNMFTAGTCILTVFFNRERDSLGMSWEISPFIWHDVPIMYQIKAARRSHEVS